MEVVNTLVIMCIYTNTSYYKEEKQEGSLMYAISIASIVLYVITVIIGLTFSHSHEFFGDLLIIKPSNSLLPNRIFSL